MKTEQNIIFYNTPDAKQKLHFMQKADNEDMEELKKLEEKIKRQK